MKDKCMDLVSILVPIYGVEKFIEKCAVSLFEQTYPNIEYVFVDDCTTDNSISVLRDIIAEYPRIGKAKYGFCIMSTIVVWLQREIQQLGMLSVSM